MRWMKLPATSAGPYNVAGIRGILVGRCRLTVTKPVLNAPIVSALEATI